MGVLGGTKNGTWGARIKILRPLFNTNTPLKPPFRHFGNHFGPRKSDFWPFYLFWSFSHWNSHWSRKKVPTWEGKVVEQKQKQFWKPWGKWQNMGACKIGYLKKSEIRITLLPEAQRTQGQSALNKVTAFKSYHMLIQIELQNLAQTSASKSWPSCNLDRTFFLQNLAQYLVSKYRPNFIFKMLTKIQLQNLDQTSAEIAILQSWSKQNKRITSRVLWNMQAHVFLHARARACYTCEHVLPTRASTLLVRTFSTTI